MDDVDQLRGTLRDLLAISMIPAAWVGREPSEIPAGLADVLMDTLHLEFVFVRLRDPSGAQALDATRGIAWQRFPEWLTCNYISLGHYTFRDVVGNLDCGGRQCRALVAPVGMEAEAGVVIAASDRGDFPNQTDRLLLSVAANQAAVAFQSARLVHDRQEALRKAQSELAHFARVSMLNELAASIAHETNQPLAAINANAAASLRLLGWRQPDLQMVREALTDIVAAGNRAASVMQRLRQLTARTEPRKTKLSINDVIAEVVALVRSDVRKHQASLRLCFAGALPAVVADRVQLQQVVINLLMNGLEAMEEVRGRPRELVVHTCAHDTTHVRVAVEDSGSGVDVASMDRLFTAFFTTKPAGMGMGLSISRSIIESHGGRLWATSNPHHGATFHFVVPAGTDSFHKQSQVPEYILRRVIPLLNQSPTESKVEIG